MERRWDLDALRGLMLVLMTLTHLPTHLAGPFGQPFGFVSAAEGFVFLSAYVAGQVYARRHQRQGEAEMRSAFLRRALKVYLCQVGLLLFLFGVVATVGVLRSQAAVTDLVDFYLQRPGAAVLAGLALIYNPPLLDILPMYVLLMLASPLLLMHGARGGWGALMCISIALWLGAQFDLGPRLYEGIARLTGLAVPTHETGAFQLLGWQLLWVLGLWMGVQEVERPDAPPLRFPRWMVLAAWGWALTCLVWRHAVGQAPFGANEALNLVFDKWRLAPLRLLDFFALLVLAMHHGAWLKSHVPRPPLLERFGRASLPVFCAHLVAVLVALTLVGAVTPERAAWIDAVVLGGAFALMAAVAWVSERLAQRAQALRARLSARRPSGLPPGRPGAWR